MGFCKRYRIWENRRRDELYVKRLNGFYGCGGIYRPGFIDVILNRDLSHPSGKLDPGSLYLRAELEDLRYDLDEIRDEFAAFKNKTKQ